MGWISSGQVAQLRAITSQLADDPANVTLHLRDGSVLQGAVHELRMGNNAHETVPPTRFYGWATIRTADGSLALIDCTEIERVVRSTPRT